MSFKLPPYVFLQWAGIGSGAISGYVTVSGYRGLTDAGAAQMVTGDTTWLAIRNKSNVSEWEEGIYTLQADGSLTRTTILRSSNNGAAVSFTAGTKDITCDVVSSKAELINSAMQLADTAALAIALG